MLCTAVLLHVSYLLPAYHWWCLS